MDNQDDQQRICSQCVGELFLSNKIETTGEIAECSYCESDGRCWRIELLADRIEQAFAEHYTRTSPDPDDWEQSLQRDKESDYDWDRGGLPVHEAIEDAAHISGQALADVLEILSERYFDFDSAAMGDECEFDADSYYELMDSNDIAWQYKWRKFEKTLRTEARYFGRAAAAHLDAVFGGIDQLCTLDGKPLVVDAGPCTPIEVLYRGRVFQSEEPLKEALCRPDRHLGTPPTRVAAAGRMNARGISVFYGATAKGVALAEVRPPVGSDVALATFRIIRPLRLLDLSALEKAFDGGSVFDPTLLQRQERVAFLQSLGRKMTRPVMPDDQEFEYLATQAVADFLATENEPTLDGIIFESTQSDEGVNIVLFHKASRVRSMDIPEGIELTAYTASYDSDGCHRDYRVSEEFPPPMEEQVPRRPRLESAFPIIDQSLVDEDVREETLEVIPASLEVHHVNRVRVCCEAHAVERHRYPKSKNKHF